MKTFWIFLQNLFSPQCQIISWSVTIWQKRAYSSKILRDIIFWESCWLRKLRHKSLIIKADIWERVPYTANNSINLPRGVICFLHFAIFTTDIDLKPESNHKYWNYNHFDGKKRFCEKFVDHLCEAMISQFPSSLPPPHAVSSGWV